jgi:molybdate transport system regulatory protein
MAKLKVSKQGSRKPAITRSDDVGYSIKGRIWVEKDGELYLGGGRIILLERLNKMGSISAAAHSMGLGYRNAWLWIDSMNRLSPSPLVEKAVGGPGGGYARLTQEGLNAIALYKKLRGRMQVIIDEESPAVTGNTGTPSDTGSPPPPKRQSGTRKTDLSKEPV